MTKVLISFPDEQDLRKVEERFWQVADERGISRSEAMRQALLIWLRTWGESMVEVTDAEWQALAPELERLRKAAR